MKNLDTYSVAYVEGLKQRIEELEAAAKQAADDEVWAMTRTLQIRTRLGDFSAHDLISGKVASHPTIHGALFALRAKVEGGGQ